MLKCNVNMLKMLYLRVYWEICLLIEKNDFSIGLQQMSFLQLNINYSVIQLTRLKKMKNKNTKQKSKQRI